MIKIINSGKKHKYLLSSTIPKKEKARTGIMENISKQDSISSTMEIIIQQDMDLDCGSPTPVHHKTKMQIGIWAKIGPP